MLEQMRETGLALWLVLGPDAVPDRHRHHRGRAILVHQDGQPVRQLEHVIGNIDARDQFGQGRGLDLALRGCGGRGLFRNGGARYGHG